MKGLRIKDQGNELWPIIVAISDEIQDFYWLIEGWPFRYYAKDGSCFDEIESGYDSLFLQTNEERDLRIAAKGFLNKYGQFVFGDWNDIYGVRSSLDICRMDNHLRTAKEYIEHHVEVYFSCVDAAFWEVYSHHRKVLEMLKEQFPKADECELKDKRY